MRYRALNLWKKKVDSESIAKQFIDLSLLFNGVKYGWGKENMEEVDCSGLISGVLNLMNYPIRQTADGFLQHFFTKSTDWSFDPEKIKAVFFVARADYKTPGGNRLEGVAKHVALLVGHGAILNAVMPYTKIEILTDVRQRYEESDCVIKELDWEKIQKDEGTYAFDPELA